MKHKIIEAAKLGDSTLIKEILNTEPNCINERDEDGYTAIMWASVKGHLEAVKILSAKADIKDMNNKNQTSVLHCAVEGGNTEIIKFLLELKSNINTKDKFGRTPLYIATNAGHEKIVKVLINNKAEINEKTQNGNFSSTPSS